MGSRLEALLEFQSTLFFVLIFSQTSGAAADALSPLLPPLFNYSCNDVHCGIGSCKASSNSTFLGLPLVPAFSCECNPGWTRFLNTDGFEFLPCVIPNCTLNYSCSPGAPAPAPPSAPPPPLDLLSFDVCSYAICGEGKCVKTSVLSYRCDCRGGYNNLLNISNFPCFPSCVLSADCINLGIGTVGKSPPPPPPPPLPQSGASAPRPPGSGREKLLQLVLLSVQMIFLSRV